MTSFDDFIKAAGTAIEQLAAADFAQYKSEAISDGKAFLQKLKSNLVEWTKQLQAGQLSEDDFKFLLAGQKDLAELAALKQSGLAAVALDNFTNSLVDTITNTAKACFLA